MDFSAPIPDSLPNIGTFQWVWLLIHAAILNVIPFVLAYLTSFYTPSIGLSCRSATFLIYFLFQIWLSAIWFWDFRNDQQFNLWHRIGEVGKSEEGQDSTAITSTTSTTSSSSHGFQIPSGMALLTVFGVIGSAFTAIFGTIFQLVGVYRNCKCLMPITAWARGDFFFQVSTHSAEAITYARKYWMATGISSIVLLIVVCYVGWWYQRHWRRLFTELIDKLLIPSPTAGQESREQSQSYPMTLST